MNNLAKALATALAVTLLATPVGSQATGEPASTPAPTPAAVRFGMDAGAISPLAAAGAAPDYATLWIGPWTLSSGWGGPDAQLTAMRNANVTPAIHFYYWGDDISQSCIENGCWSNLHNAQKDKAGWQRLAEQLAAHLESKMQGKPAVIFLESEFNKGNVATYEPLDGYLAEKADYLHAQYPAAQIVMSLGNWNSAAWPTWDRTAAASDYVGIQGMRGSTRESATQYATLYEAVLGGARTLQQQFGQPVFLTDIALSTYPEPDYLTRQADELGQFFTGLEDLRAAGVEAIVYRSWKDSPNMDLKNYYGEAERHWGLSWAYNGTQKAAGQVWLEGVKAERSRAAVPANVPPTPTFAATVAGLQVTVDASASSDPDGDALSFTWAFGDNAAAAGATATHAYAQAGTYTITLTASDGTDAVKATRSVTLVQPYTATITPGPGSNEWWVEAKVNGSAPAAKVEAKAGDGAWKALRQRDAATWAEGLHVVKGTPVSFRATDANGQTVTTAAKPWMGSASSTSSTTSSSTSTTPTAFKASFTPKAVGNDWWVESAASGNQGITKVEAKVNSGAWTVLPKTDWGTYAKSLNAPNGSKVTFRATATSGTTSTSGTYTWT